jgi:hypothetical protein
VEEHLAGGVNQVTRIGGTVRRPTGPWTPAVHALLDHLATAGFDGAPRVYGIDDAGREVLEYIPGDVTEDPPDGPGLVAVARLLRRYHDAAAGFRPAPDAHWQLPPQEPAGTICHGDIATYNCVFRNGLPVAFIDFDTAHPGPPLSDVAYAAYRFVPLPPAASSPDGAAQRLRMFCDAYGLDEAGRHALPDTVGARLRALVEFMRSQAAAGHVAFQRHLAEGHAETYLADIVRITADATRLRHALLDRT